MTSTSSVNDLGNTPAAQSDMDAVGQDHPETMSQVASMDAIKARKIFNTEKLIFGNERHVHARRVLESFEDLMELVTEHNLKGVQCEACGGEGDVECEECEGVGKDKAAIKCDVCTDGVAKCEECNGNGSFDLSQSALQQETGDGLSFLQERVLTEVA